MDSIRKWKEYSNQNSFITEFDTIINQYSHDNEIRTSKVEEFLISAAKKAGVIKTIQNKIQKNPNRWAKHLAPWFEDSCKEARQQYRQLKRVHRKKHVLVKTAYQEYKTICKK